MKKVTLLFSFVIIALIGFTQNQTSDCSKFKAGKFRYYDAAKTEVIITRTKNKQQEVIPSLNVITKFKILWIEDCAYEITQVWSNSKTRRKANRSITRVNITKAYDDRYDYSCACKDSASANNNKGTMFLIK